MSSTSDRYGRHHGPWPPHDDATYRSEAESSLGEDLCRRLRRVRAVVFDCDGVLTDGRMYYDGDGE